MSVLSFVLSIVSVSVLATEYWLGIAISGLGEDDVIYRSKTPGPYWFWMILHTLILIGVPTLAWLAGI